MSQLAYNSFADRHPNFGYRLGMEDFSDLMHWRLHGVPVHVFASSIRRESTTARQSMAQRAVLRGLGVDFREMDHIAFSAFSLRTGYPEDDVVIVLNEGTEKHVPLAETKHANSRLR